MIKTNNELTQAVRDAISESGIKKGYIAECLGLSKQGFTNLMNKKNFSLDDANRILSIIGYKATVKINKKHEKKSIKRIDITKQM